MSELDAMLDAPVEAVLPPLVRFYKERRAAGDRVEVELCRPDSTGGLARTELFVRRWVRDEEQEPRQAEWDDGVNDGLVNLGVRAVDLRQEGERFALSIRAKLRKAERRYGDGYLNAVLVDLLNESDLSKGQEIANVLQHVHTNPPERSRSYGECRELIASEISGRAVELRDKLGYNPEQVKTVMTTALAIYLDERFSVTSRRNFGWLPNPS